MLTFVMSVQDSPKHQPTKRPLYNPAFRQYLECVNIIVPLHDFQPPGGLFLDPLDQLTTVAAIRPNQFNAGQATTNPENQLFGSVAVLNLRRMYDDPNEQSQNIYEDVALDPLDLFPGVVARVFRPRVGLDGLRIDDECAGFFFSSVFFRTSRQRRSWIFSQ